MGNAQFHTPNHQFLGFGAGNIAVEVAVEVVVEELDFDIVAVVVGIARMNNKTTGCADQQISFDFRILDMNSFLSPQTIFARFFIGSLLERRTDVRPRVNPNTPLYSYL